MWTDFGRREQPFFAAILKEQTWEFTGALERVPYNDWLRVAARIGIGDEVGLCHGP